MARKLRLSKDKILEACVGCNGIADAVRQKLGISRRAFYNYRQRWPEIQQAIDDELEVGLDAAESQLMKLVKQKDFRAIAFFLERRGRARGWGAQQQLAVKSETPLQPIICFDEAPPGGQEDSDAAADA